MSLEIGRKLGLISSLIFIIVPIIAGALLVSLFAILLSVFQTSIGSNTIPSNPFAFAGFGIVFTVSIGVMAIVGLIGVVLLIVAMYNLSLYYREPAIFKNILYAVIINIVSGATAFIFQFAYLIPSSATITPGRDSTTIFTSAPFIAMIAIVIAAVILTIVSAVLIMRAFNKLGEKSEVDHFKTAGLLYLIGVLLSIIAIGAIIVWIAFIFAAIGFYRLKPLTVYVAETAPPMTLQTKRCPNCSTENRMDATYCRFCGKPLD